MLLSPAAVTLTHRLCGRFADVRQFVNLEDADHVSLPIFKLPRAVQTRRL